MLLLILITIALVIASSFLLLTMHRAFERAVSWFDERSIMRENALSKLEETSPQQRSADHASASALGDKASSTESEEEWAEYIEM